MTTSIFLRSKLDKPDELEEESKNPFGKLKRTDSATDINRCGCCSFLTKRVSNSAEENDEREDKQSRRKTLWMSFAGDREAFEIERKILSSRLILRSPGYLALLSTQFRYRVPLFVDDIQRFLILAVLRAEKYDYFSTKWVDIIRRSEIVKNIVLVVDGATQYHYKIYKKTFLNLTNAFHSCFDIMTTSTNDGSVIEELSVVPTMASDHENVVKMYGCIESALVSITDITTTLRTVFPITLESKTSTNGKCNDVFPRTRLVLHASDLVDEGFPIPVPGKLSDKCSDYVMTKDKYLPLSPTSPLFSLACERCDQNDLSSGLYRITLVDEKYDVIYDSYVLPYNKYLRHKTVSDLTMQMLLDIKTRIKEAHVQIKKSITPDAILVGETLNEDLHSLKLMHPYVISTNTIFNITGSKRWRSKLKDVSRHYLDREIEDTQKEFSSVEHATASMELVHLKLAHNIQFGDKVLTRQQDKHILIENMHKKLTQKSSVQFVDEEVVDTPIILGNEATIKKYTEFISKKHSGKTENMRKVKLVPCSSNRNVVNSMKSAINDNFLIMGHLDFTNKDSLNAETCFLLDKWIRAIWNACPSDTLISVLLTGDGERNGLFFVNIKE